MSHISILSYSIRLNNNIIFVIGPNNRIVFNKCTNPKWTIYQIQNGQSFQSASLKPISYKEVECLYNSIGLGPLFIYNENTLQIKRYNVFINGEFGIT